MCRAVAKVLTRTQNDSTESWALVSLGESGRKKMSETMWPEGAAAEGALEDRCHWYGDWVRDCCAYCPEG